MDPRNRASANEQESRSCPIALAVNHRSCVVSTQKERPVRADWKAVNNFGQNRGPDLSSIRWLSFVVGGSGKATGSSLPTAGS